MILLSVSIASAEDKSIEIVDEKYIEEEKEVESVRDRIQPRYRPVLGGALVLGTGFNEASSHTIPPLPDFTGKEIIRRFSYYSKDHNFPQKPHSATVYYKISNNKTTECTIEVTSGNHKFDDLLRRVILTMDGRTMTSFRFSNTFYRPSISSLECTREFTLDKSGQLKAGSPKEMKVSYFSPSPKKITKPHSNRSAPEYDNR